MPRDPAARSPLDRHGLDWGRVVLEARPEPGHLNFGGIVHGGYLSAAMDGAVGFALHSTLGPGRVCPHVQAGYRFLRAALAGQDLRVDAWALRSGRHLGHARVEIRGPGGDLLCSGESTHALIGALDGARAAERRSA